MSELAQKLLRQAMGLPATERAALVESLELPISERIQLVAEIWDSIAAVPEKIQLTPSARKLLAKRIETFRANHDSGSPWAAVRSRIVSG